MLQGGEFEGSCRTWEGSDRWQGFGEKLVEGKGDRWQGVRIEGRRWDRQAYELKVVRMSLTVWQDALNEKP